MQQLEPRQSLVLPTSTLLGQFPAASGSHRSSHSSSPLSDDTQWSTYSSGSNCLPNALSSPLTPSTTGPVTPSPTLQPSYPPILSSPDHILYSADTIRTGDPVPSTELACIWSIPEPGYINDYIPDYSHVLSEFMGDSNSPSTSNHPSLEASLSLPHHSTFPRPQSVLSWPDLPATAFDPPSISPCDSSPPYFPPYDHNTNFAPPSFASSMDTSVDNSNVYVTGLVDELTHLSLDEGTSGAHAPNESSSLVPAEFSYAGHHIDPPRALDGDLSPGPLDCQAGPSRPARRRCRRPSPYVAPSEGAAFSPTVAKPTVLEASLARRKKEGKYSCHLCSATFTEKHGVTNHLNSHYGIKPHECARCGKRFGTTHTRNRHAKTCRTFMPMPQEVKFIDMVHQIA
ncbi:hypothetical protein PM082_022581 [Marasmius tenuissimus]|nr:hypothetical protein PM082_022581 [Marasmius tenuissimus]